MGVPGRKQMLESLLCEVPQVFPLGSSPREQFPSSPYASDLIRNWLRLIH
jgi:hypothetical protein